MSINAITAFSFSSSFNRIDFEHEEIKKQLMSLGKTPSGSKTVDKAMLDVALKEMELEKTTNLTSQKVTENNTGEENKYSNDFIYILNTLGITKTGDAQKDYKEAILAIKSKMMEEIGTADRSYYRRLKDSLDNIAFGLNISLETVSSSVMLGADVVSDKNKQMALGAI